MKRSQGKTLKAPGLDPQPTQAPSFAVQTIMLIKFPSLAKALPDDTV